MATPQRRQPRRRTTVRRLLLVRLFIVLVPILLLQAWVYHHDYQAKREAELQANLEVARAVAASFDAFVDGLQREEHAVGQGLALLSPFSAQRAAPYLEHIAGDYPQVDSMSWLAADGGVVASSDRRLVGTRWPDRLLLATIGRGRDWVVTDVTRTQDARDARFTVAHGARDTAGALKGIVTAVVDPNRLDEVIGIRRSGGAAVSLVDRTGWLAFRLPALDPPYAERDWGKLYPMSVARALAGHEAKAVEYSSYQRGRRVIGSVPVAGTGWVGSAGRPEAEALAPIRAATAGSAATFLLVATLGVLLATVGARTITGPIDRLRRSAQAIGSGSFDVEAPESGPTELVELGVALNQMAEEIRTREEALQAGEERYRSLFETMQEGFALHEIICDEAGKPVDYRFLEVNPAFERQTGLTRDQVIGRTVLEAMPGTEPEWIETYGRVALTGQPARLERHAAALGRDFEAFAFSPNRGQFAVVLTDVTERKQVEQEHARQARLLDAIVENTGTLLAYLDPDLNFLRVNSAYAAAGRRAEEEFVGRNHFELYPHDENRGIFTAVRETGRPARFTEKPFEHPDQPERGMTYWDWTLTPVKDERGAVEGLVLSLADVTDRVEQRERLLAAERARADLAESLNNEIDHRIKNNLAMISGLIQMQLTSEQDQHTVAALRETSARIRTFAALHDRIYGLPMGELDLLEVLKRVGAATADAFAVRGAAQITVEGNRWACHSRVATNLAVITNELITNALKYGGPGADGRRRVRINLAVGPDEIRLSVWNSGNPVQEGFDPGRQQGMGLRLVFEMVTDQYQGRFRLSPSDAGTLAEAVIPLTELAVEALPR